MVSMCVYIHKCACMHFSFNEKKTLKNSCHLVDKLCFGRLYPNSHEGLANTGHIKLYISLQKAQ